MILSRRTGVAGCAQSPLTLRQTGHTTARALVLSVLIGIARASSINADCIMHKHKILPAESEADCGRALDLSYLLQDKTNRMSADEYHLGESPLPGSTKVKPQVQDKAGDLEHSGPTEEGGNADPADPTEQDQPREPISTTIETFDAAMQSACTSDTRAGLFDTLEPFLTVVCLFGKVGSEAMEHVTGWMEGLFGTMLRLQSDPEALYNYLRGNGGLVLVALALAGIVLSSLVLYYQGRGVTGSQQLYCQTYLFADEMLRGSASLAPNGGESEVLLHTESPKPIAMEPEEPNEADNPKTQLDTFAGLLPLTDTVEALALLFDKANPENILEQAKKSASNALDVTSLERDMLEAMESLKSACIALSANNSLPGAFHKSLWCEASQVRIPSESSNVGLPHASTAMITSASKIVGLKPQQHVDKLFTEFQLPDLNVAESFPIDLIRQLFLNATDLLSSTEETVSKLLRWLGIGLRVDAALHLLILLLVALWTLCLFFRGNKAGGCFSAFLWNSLVLVAIVFLVLGGLLGWITTLGRQGCSILTDYCLEQDNWDLFTDLFPVAEPLVTQCLNKEGEGDLLDGAGLAETYDEMLGTVKSTLEKFPSAVYPLDPKTSELAQSYLDAAMSFGTLVTVDPESAPSIRRQVFPEFLESGMQRQDVEVEGKIIYGLETLERLVAPWKLPSLHPDDETDREYNLEDANPVEGDPKYIKWLDELKESKKVQLMASGQTADNAEKEAEAFKVHTKNGIWWLQQKKRLLDLSYACKNREQQEQLCGYEEMFGLGENQMQVSYMYGKQLAAGRSFSAAIEEINNKAIFPFEYLRESLTCRFLRRNILQFTILGCESTVFSFYHAALYRALGGGMAFLSALIIIFLWLDLLFTTSELFREPWEQ
ncbi:hypothetical protein cyc_00206 [Cyclospora cayetanensis]|uniref:Uncharacterized protein n=1 Tax=Cyclospora cayetanensis TaxID=88456 RepID=A0A1D3D695_9EIME|nr:hypothetical protein cyc_00206 [Cyclospora cayetanensis]